MPMCALTGCTTSKDWETCQKCGTMMYPAEIVSIILKNGAN